MELEAKEKAEEVGSSLSQPPIEPTAPVTPVTPIAPVTPVVPEKTIKKTVIKNSLGQEVPEEDYFFGGKAPNSFEAVCGYAVDREDLLEVFNKVFNPDDNILFYRQKDKEVYIVIIPLKYSSVVGKENDSIDGDFQKHAISFLNEGSVNMDTLKMKLKRILPFIKFSDR